MTARWQTSSRPTRVNYFNTPPEMVIDSDAQYQAVISTSQGDLVVELFAEVAPSFCEQLRRARRPRLLRRHAHQSRRPDDSIIFGLPDDNPLNDAGYKIAAELNSDIELNLGIMTYIPVENPAGDTILSSSSQVLLALVTAAARIPGPARFFRPGDGRARRAAQLDTEDTIE